METKMKALERLNEKQWLTQRESAGTIFGAGWNYRCIFTTENVEGFVIGETIPRVNGSVQSLCQATAILFFGECNDHGDYSDLKESFLSVLRGECTIEEAKEYHKID
jgi:hypothetical protein